MSTSQTVASWTIVITKGNPYQKTITWTDSNGNPISFVSQEIDITPNGSPPPPPFSWTQANGKYTNTGVGQYLIMIDEAETAGYTWTSGKYKISGVDGSGEENACFLEGLIFAKPC